MTVAVPVKKPNVKPVEDVQGHADTRQIPINKVGIKDIYHPIKVKDRARGEQHTVANFDMYVNAANFKGTHMSHSWRYCTGTSGKSPSTRSAKMLVEMTEPLDAAPGTSK